MSAFHYIKGTSLALTDEMSGHLEYIYEANPIVRNAC